MSTVTAPPTKRPPFGSIESYAEMIRAEAYARTTTDVYVVVTGFITSIVDSARIARTEAEQAEHVRNALAAGELVRAEMRRARA